MPSAATDIFSLAEARLQLRLDDDVEDPLVESAVQGAVDYCQRLAGKPFLDVATTLYLERPSLADAPMRIPRQDVKEITAFEYWETSQEWRDEPSGTVVVDDLGRRQEDGWDTLLWPPEDGWPEVLTGSVFQVGMTLGFADADSIPGIAGIKMAVAAMTTVHFEGTPEEDHRNLVLDLLTPYRDARALA